MKDNKLIVKKIEKGTVIDHLRPSSALIILNDILNPEIFSEKIYSVLANVDSSRAHGDGKKDILKIEDVELTPEETNKIALLSPYATINIIKDYEVVEKRQVDLPDEVIGIVRCGNERCITNYRDKYGRKEPIDYKFDVLSKDPVVLRCHYCERKIPEDGKTILDYFV